MKFVNIFLQIVAYFSPKQRLKKSLTQSKSLKLLWSLIYQFFLLYTMLVVSGLRILSSPREQSFSPLFFFSPKMFMLYILYLIHYLFFSLFSYKVWNLKQYLFFCLWMSSCSSTIFLKGYPLHCFYNFVKSQPYSCGSIFLFSLLFHCSVFLSLHQYHRFLITVAI